ncbi:MAG: xanthine phosphoribosyltransferase [Alphaproteobacteria bacterium]|nr:xanthine phosphoribosyltransferase [Alphaproteobacteria bacterium]
MIAAATPPQKYFPVSWEELHRNAKALAWKLHDMGEWKGVIAVTRGGLVPAAVVARELEIRVIETVSVVGYYQDESIPGSPQTVQFETAQVIKQPANVGDGEGWLVVDDLVDTGRTVEVLRKMLPKAHFATVYAKPMGKPLIDTFVTEVSQDTWINFPWDIELQFTQPIAAQRKNGNPK